MKYLLTLLILLNAHTLNAIEIDMPEIQIGGGITFTEKPPNTLWYQKEFDHSINSDSTNYQIGLRFNHWDNIYLTTGYKYLGKFGVSADFIANDYTYFESLKGGKDPPLSHLTGKGKAHGIYFKGEYHFKHVFLTGGLWAHKTEWSVSSPSEMRMYRYGAKKGVVHGPYNIQHKPDEKVVYGWIYGIGVKYGKVSVLAEIWDIENSTGDYPSTFQGSAQVITVLYTLF